MTLRVITTFFIRIKMRAHSFFAIENMRENISVDEVNEREKLGDEEEEKPDFLVSFLVCEEIFIA